MSRRASARSALETSVHISSSMTTGGSGGNPFGMNALYPVGCWTYRPARPFGMTAFFLLTAIGPPGHRLYFCQTAAHRNNLRLVVRCSNNGNSIRGTGARAHDTIRVTNNPRGWSVIPLVGRL